MSEGFTVTVTGGRTIWIDDYRCELCGEISEVALRPGQPLQVCACGGDRHVVIDKAKDWEMKVTKGDGRIIWSDKQIESSHGKDWRETSKRPFSEGGAGARQYYDGGAGRYHPNG
ncbi:MAG: hypothetical protein KJN79_00190 [Gammaproteobacteria bacterium]|nr:hypothetical protein [Gammaproteobacteria bacterium]